MNISGGFIRRPVATALLMVAIVLLGATAYTLLPVAALPNVAYPTISVTAQLPGTDPRTMASSVATPLEKQFGEIPYLTQMTSTSSTGYTQITLQFALNDDIGSAATLVQAAINAAAGQLPKTLFTQPTYHETNPADAPILVLGVTSDSLPITAVDDYAESILAQKISQVPGVGLVGIGGMQHPSVRISIDPAKLAAIGLEMEDVRNSLTNVSVDSSRARCTVRPDLTRCRQTIRSCRQRTGTVRSSPGATAGRSGSQTSDTPKSDRRTSRCADGST